jgi:hypothetical protein
VEPQKNLNRQSNPEQKYWGWRYCSIWFQTIYKVSIMKTVWGQPTGLYM